MTHDAKAHRAANKAKAKKMAHGDPHQKVDASSWEPPEPLETTKKTGCRPVGKQAYKRGGKVVEHMEGREPAHHAGKSPRGFDHGSVRTGNKKPNYEGGTRPTGGRMARAEGGATTLKDMPIPKVTPGYKRGGKTGKGKTNINIIIGGSHRDSQPSAPPMPPQPIRPPGMMMPPGGMPMPPPPMPPAAPPGAAMGAMPRKSGGKAYRSYKDLDVGAGSGEGRLAKTEIEEKRS